jgi:hypothetical protein
MNHRWTKFGTLVAGALVVPAALGAMAFPGVASATTPAGSTTCSGIALKVSGTKATVSFTKCGDTANTGGSGTINATTLAKKGPQPVVITWASKGTTTTTLTVTKGGSGCTSGWTKYSALGTVKSDTGKATSIKVGNKVSVYLCTKGTTVQFMKGSVFTV